MAEGSALHVASGANAPRRVVSEGMYVILRDISSAQRIAKVGPNSATRLGKMRIPGEALLGMPLGSTLRFEGGIWRRMQPVCSTEGDDGDENDGAADLLAVVGDNRNLFDSNTAQRLSAADVAKMKDEGASSGQIVGSLVEHSESFSNKTQFSKQKYIAKKQRKHVQQVTIIEPTLSDVCETYRMQKPLKVCGLRPDYLGALLSHGNVGCGSRVLLLDDSMGLATAAVAIRLGGVGRAYRLSVKGDSDKIIDEMDSNGALRRLVCSLPLDLLESKAPMDHPWLRAPVPGLAEKASDRCLTGDDVPMDKSDTILSQRREEREARRLARISDFEKLCSDGVTALVAVVSPRRSSDGSVMEATKIVHRTIDVARRYVRPDGRIVLYSTNLQPLCNVQAMMHRSDQWLHIRMEELFLREHQVLPQRTHPKMQSSVALFQGFLLSAIRVE